MRAPLLLLCAAASLLSLATSASSLQAALWSPSRIADLNAQQYNERVVGDGAGGAIVAWRDNRSSSDQVFVQHLLSSGSVDPAWPSNGLLIGPFNNSLALVSDGSGGAIVSWDQTASQVLYAQHVLASGVVDPAWPSGGVLFCSALNTRNTLQPVTDGAGGAIIAWADSRNGNFDIYAQRILASGAAGWPVNGVAVVAATGTQSAPAAASDGSGGMILCWQSNSTEIDAQRITSAGTVASGWAAGGVVICAAAGNQSKPAICTDGSSGAIIEWVDTRNAHADIYAMRVRSNGNLGSGWTADGVNVFTSTTNQATLSIIADGSGGAISAWSDGADIFAQRITSSGSAAWTANGVHVCTAADNQQLPSLAPDGSSGAFIVWHDRGLENPNPHPDVFVHHVQSAGAVDPSWPANGARVTFDGATGTGPGHEPVIAASGAGNAFVAWDGSTQNVNVMEINSTWTQLVPLQVTVAPSASGSVTVSPSQLSYAVGTQISLAAGGPFPFLNWSGDASGSGNPLTLTMDGPKNVTANFAAYTLTTAASPAGVGTVTRSPDQSLYPPGQVTLTATVTYNGYQFDHWSGDASGSVNPVQLDVNGNKSVTANFTLIPPSCGHWSVVGISGGGGRPAQWDPVNARVLQVGGGSQGQAAAVRQFTIAAGWSQITTAGSGPSNGLDLNQLVFDSQRNRMLSVGGTNWKLDPYNDVWALSLSGTPTWSLVSGNPTALTRFYFTAIYDPVRDRVIIYGGSISGHATGDVWSLSLSGTPTWTQITPSGPAPPVRDHHVAIYDPVRDRMIIHGGFGTAAPLNDTWALSLSGTPTWSQLTPQGAPPPPMWSSAAIYDPVRDRFMVISGYAATEFDTDHVWALSLATEPFWTQLPSEGVNLGARGEHVAVYEPDLDLIVASGGNSDLDGSVLFDTRRLDCAGGLWLQAGAVNGSVQVVPSKACYATNDQVTLVASPSGGAMFDHWIGDASGNANPLDVTMDASKTIFAEILPRDTGVEDAPLSFALDVWPNPSAGPFQIRYALPREAPVRLSVYDIAGREVVRLVSGSQPTGRHTVSWSVPRNGSRPRSGVYLVRYETPAGGWTRRIVLVK
jgi:hypothetical protein